MIKFFFEDGEAETTVIIDDSGEDPDEPTATPTGAPFFNKIMLNITCYFVIIGAMTEDGVIYEYL